jgi:hypothetical protein
MSGVYEVKDTSKMRIVDGRHPDICFYPKGSSCDVVNIAFLAEIKIQRKGDFEDADKGEVLTFAQRLLKVQPFRNEVTVFLCDCYSIQFFKVEREEPSFRYLWTAKFPLFEKVNVQAARRKGGSVKKRLPAEGIRLLHALFATQPSSMYGQNVESIY